jgi:serine/threonine-protein kinase RIO1
MSIYTKYVQDISVEKIRREVSLQRLASAMQVAPAILEDIPVWIRSEIIEHIWTLYSCCQIQYIDITPYNFIEHEGRVWVIDFGDAFRNRPKAKLHPFLKRMFDTWTLTMWNPEFK